MLVDSSKRQLALALALARMYKQGTNRQSLRNVRDLLDCVARSIGAHLKKTQNSQDGKSFSKEEIDECESTLSKMIGDKSAVEAAIQAAFVRISKGTRRLSNEKLSPAETWAILVEVYSALNSIGDSIDPTWIKESAMGIFRGKAGRRPDQHKQAIFQQADMMAKQRIRYDLIARQLLPKEYTKDRSKARQSIKAGVHRLRQKQSQKASPIS